LTLARALRKIDPDGEGTLSRLLSAHPPMDDRTERLRRLAG
jgi:Zn-dependent protease with chaperone function